MINQPFMLRVKLTVVYLLMVTFGAFIMLCIMTFDAGIFFTVVVG